MGNKPANNRDKTKQQQKRRWSLLEGGVVEKKEEENECVGWALGALVARCGCVCVSGVVYVCGVTMGLGWVVVDSGGYVGWCDGKHKSPQRSVRVGCGVGMEERVQRHKGVRNSVAH